MVSSFSLSSLSYDCVASSLGYKLQDLEKQARYQMQGSSVPQANTTRMEQISKCVELLIKSFFDFGYNTAIALLVSIPASIHKNSQAAFPKTRKFWKDRIYQAGTSLGVGFAKIIVLTKLVGVIHVIGSIICYFKPSYRPRFQEIDKMSSIDIDCAVTTALLGTVIAHVNQRNLIDRITTFTTLILYSTRSVFVETMNKAYKWVSPIPINQKDLESSYDKRCCEIIRRLDESNNLQEVSDAIFTFFKQALVQTIDSCDDNASVIAKCVANSMKNILTENAVIISQYCQKEFSEMKTSLENAKNSKEIILALKDFSSIFREIFQGLHMAIQYEKNHCMTEIVDLLQANHTEEFVDALSDQDWL